MALRWRYETWRKLYVREVGSFATLPLYARALAAELLKLCDDDGCIKLGGRAPVDAIAFQLGANRGDRRLLKMHVPMLLADGYLVHAGDVLTVRNFDVAQAGRDRISVAADPPPGHDGATTEQRPSDDATTTEQRPCNDRATKHELVVENHDCLSRSSFRDLPDQSQTQSSREAEEDSKRAARKVVRDTAWHDFRACLDELAAEGIGRGSKALQFEPGQTLLATLISLASEKSPLDDVLANIRHALSVRMAEVRSDPKTLRYFNGLMFESASFSRTVARQLSEFPSRCVRPMPWERKSPIAAEPEDDWETAFVSLDFESGLEMQRQINRRTGAARSVPLPKETAA